jgi:hypothetical protein
MAVQAWRGKNEVTKGACRMMSGISSATGGTRLPLRYAWVGLSDRPERAYGLRRHRD